MPVFADIEPTLFCLDAAKVEAKIGPRTKAVVAVNLFGQPAALAPIRAIADRRGLVMVEDNAQAPAARYHNTLAGTVGHLGVLSLNRHKTMQCGEGGIVLTNDAALAERVALVRNHAESVVPDWGRYDNADIVGYNYRLTELQAAVAIPQLARIDELNAWRARLANALTARLDGCGWFLPAQVRADCQHVYYLYPLLLQPEVAGVRRDTVLAALKAEGVHASAYVPPLYRLPIFTRHAEPEAPAYARLFPQAAAPGWSDHCCPVVERVEDHQMIVTNICRPPLGEAEIDEFVAAIDKVTSEVDALRAWERAQAG
jgi:perosamine synthetase